MTVSTRRSKRATVAPPSSSLSQVSSTPEPELKPAEPSVPDSEPEYELAPELSASHRHKRPRISTDKDNNPASSASQPSQQSSSSPKRVSTSQHYPGRVIQSGAASSPDRQPANATAPSSSLPEPPTQSDNVSQFSNSTGEPIVIAPTIPVELESGRVASPARPSQNEPQPTSTLTDQISPPNPLGPHHNAPPSHTNSPKPDSPHSAPNTALPDFSRSQLENLPPLPAAPNPAPDANPPDAFLALPFSQSQPEPVRNDSGLAAGEVDDSGVFVQGFADEADDDEGKAGATPPAAEDDRSSSQVGGLGEDEVMLAVEEEEGLVGEEGDEVILGGGDEEPIMPPSSSGKPSQPPVWLSDITPALGTLPPHPPPPAAEVATTTAATDAPPLANAPPHSAPPSEPAEPEELAIPPSSEGYDYGDEIWQDMVTMDWTGTQQARGADAAEEDEDEPFPEPTPAPGFVDPGEAALPAFVSGKGKAFSLSKAALDKAAAFLAGVEDDEAAAAAAGLPSAKDEAEPEDEGQATPVASRVAEVGGSQESARAEDDPDFEVPEVVTFAFGRGKKTYVPSAAAIAASKKLLEHQSPEKARAAKPDPEQTPLPQARTAAAPQASSSPARPESAALVPSSPGAASAAPGPAPMLGFTSGSGAFVAGPSQAMRDQAAKRLSAGEGDVFGSETPLRPARGQPGNAQAAADGAAASPLPRSRAGLGESTPAPTRTAAGALATPAAPAAPLSSPSVPKHAGFAPVIQPTPLSKPGFNSPALNSPALSRTNSTGTPSRYPSFRPPLGPRPAGSTPGGLMSGLSTPKATPGSRRINTDMNKRTRPNTIQKFSTPFKNGVRPEGLTVGGTPGSARKASAGAGRAAEPKPARAQKVEQMFEPVFDLRPRGPRTKLGEVGWRPQAWLAEQLQALGVPDEAIFMTAASAVGHVFEDGRSEKDALAAMLAAGCALATEAWVKNHWSLVVWKLASTVRSQPDLLLTYWSFEAALNQLLYRYERETNRAERSAVKRIQEQDSPATLPLVLCVSQVIWDDPPDVDMGAVEPGNGPPLVIVGLELTDGWYRIRASIDATLRSAAQRGKIVEGSKLVVQGAKLEASREGTEVLQALTKSTLAINGNSTALAPWHAKLGFAGQVFAAGLESITPEGGPVPLLDVVVENVFPVGYTEFGKGAARGSWGAEEEKERKEKEEKGREEKRAKLLDKAEKERLEYDELFELLQEAAARCGAPGASQDGDAAEEPDEAFDRIEAAANKAAVVAKLAPRLVHGCLDLAAHRVEQSRHQAILELDQEVEDEYPKRDVRAFRIIRIRDAREPGGGGKAQAKAGAGAGGKPRARRTAQLTVWRPEELGEGFLQVGKRYLVGTVLPKGGWRRTTEEITLATGRGTRWRLFGED